MSDILSVYSFIPQIHTASSYYRIAVQAQTAHELGLNARFMIDTNIEGMSPEQRIKNFCESDVVLFYQPISPDTLNNVKLAKNFLPSKIDGKWKYPPTFILDTDDNLFRIDPHNPAFGGLGVRDPDTGKEISKGFSISELQDGVRKLLWKDGAQTADGQVPFDVERNKANIETYVQLINWADAVTCTTPRCAEPVKEYASPRKIHVTPNLVRFNDYPQLDIVKDTSRINILWQGGQNHYGDWRPLKDTLGRLTEKYPQIHWIMWGVNYSDLNELIPPHRMTFLPWCDYREYKLRRVMVNEDISLAPLSDTPFNNCRSAIKWYEASVQKNPAATLAQRTGPYMDEIQDGETGLLYSEPQEFEDKLSLLIENSEERRTLGKNAKDWMSQNRDAHKEVPKLIQFYEELRAEIQQTVPHMPDRAWDIYEAQVKEQQAKEAEAQKQAA